MTKDELYNELWLIFEPFARGLDEERKTALDGLIDVAARKLATATVGRDQVHKAMKRAGVQGLMIAKVFASL